MLRGGEGAPGWPSRRGSPFDSAAATRGAGRNCSFRKSNPCGPRCGLGSSTGAVSSRVSRFPLGLLKANSGLQLFRVLAPAISTWHPKRAHSKQWGELEDSRTPRFLLARARDRRRPPPLRTPQEMGGCLPSCCLWPAHCWRVALPPRLVCLHRLLWSLEGAARACPLRRPCSPPPHHAEVSRPPLPCSQGVRLQLHGQV